MFLNLLLFVTISTLNVHSLQQTPQTDDDRLPAPWHVTIIVGQCLRTKCGGVLLSCNYILTAAHCVSFLMEPVHPALIDIYTSSTKLNNNSKNYKVEQIYLHPDLQRGVGLEHDIAILKIKPKIVYTKHLVKASLPKKPPPDFMKGLISGYPTTDSPFCNMSLLLQHPLTLRTSQIETAPCRSFMRSAMFQSEVYVHCISPINLNGWKDCLRESGDPIVLKNGRKNILHGIIVKGNCDETPHVFVQIYPHVKWIYHIIRHH